MISARRRSPPATAFPSMVRLLVWAQSPAPPGSTATSSTLRAASSRPTPSRCAFCADLIPSSFYGSGKPYGLHIRASSVSQRSDALKRGGPGQDTHHRTEEKSYTAMAGYAWLDVGGILSYPTANHSYRISGGVRRKLGPQP